MLKYIPSNMDIICVLISQLNQLCKVYISFWVYDIDYKIEENFAE